MPAASTDVSGPAIVIHGVIFRQQLVACDLQHPPSPMTASSVRSTIGIETLRCTIFIQRPDSPVSDPWLLPMLSALRPWSDFLTLDITPGRDA